MMAFSARSSHLCQGDRGNLLFVCRVARTASKPCGPKRPNEVCNLPNALHCQQHNQNCQATRLPLTRNFDRPAVSTSRQFKRNSLTGTPEINACFLNSWAASKRPLAAQEFKKRSGSVCVNGLKWASRISMTFMVGLRAPFLTWNLSSARR